MSNDTVWNRESEDGTGQRTYVCALCSLTISEWDFSLSLRFCSSKWIFLNGVSIFQVGLSSKVVQVFFESWMELRSVFNIHLLVMVKICIRVQYSLRAENWYSGFGSIRVKSSLIKDD